MKGLSIVLAVVCSVPAGLCHAEMRLAGGTTFAFATVEEGRRILETRDDYVQRMSAFDRAARLKTDKQVSEEEFLKHAGQCVRAWSKTQRQNVETALEALRPGLEELHLFFPARIYLITTTGDEEGDAAYTRQNAVVLPKGTLAGSRGAMRKLLCHELFHVLSRANPQLRERLYQAIGFVKCNEVELPAPLRPRKITNPDAPCNDHYIRVQLGGQPCLAVPILLASSETYDVARGGVFFDYLQFRFLLVEQGRQPNSVQVRYDAETPLLAEMRKVSGFFEQVGRNTGYTIHPEEVLAENFVLLVLPTPNVRSPEILAKIRAVLTSL